MAGIYLQKGWQAHRYSFSRAKCIHSPSKVGLLCSQLHLPSWLSVSRKESPPKMSVERSIVVVSSLGSLLDRDNGLRPVVGPHSPTHSHTHSHTWAERALRLNSRLRIIRSHSKSQFRFATVVGRLVAVLQVIDNTPHKQIPICMNLKWIKVGS